MNVVHARCAGLDIHKASITACIRWFSAGAGKAMTLVKSFGTTTDEILALGDWLANHAVTHAAMESTGVFWKPIFNLLETRFTLLLVNAQHMKRVPGRKTDVKDCEWIAQLLQHGLLTASFVPPRPVRQLRELARHRVQLINDRTRVINRVHKTLEDANVKLGTVASDIMGVSGRAMIQAIIQGEEDPEKLAELARARLREKIPQLKRALTARITAHHRFMLSTLMTQLHCIESLITSAEAQIAMVMQELDNEDDSEDEADLGWQAAVQLLTSIPGVETQAAENILVEIGLDMKQFPTAANLASWAGVSPGNNESAGKRRSGQTTKGNKWLLRSLTQAAWAASRTKDTYFAAKYRRLASRRGKKRAIVAIGHTMLRVIYHMLSKRVPYQDLGADYFNRLDPERQIAHHVKRLEQLGLAVTVEPRETSPAA